MYKNMYYGSKNLGEEKKCGLKKAKD